MYYAAVFTGPSQASDLILSEFLALPGHLTTSPTDRGGYPTVVRREDLTSVAKQGGERLYKPEAWRVKGELLVQGSELNVQSRVEECFHTALELARQQEAKLLELRATMSLSRLWHQQGKTAEARELLALIYGWFTEGFDTPDLQEAKALLDGLQQ